MADLETRLRHGLREYADSQPVTVGRFEPLPGAAPSRRFRRPLLAAAVVVVLLAGVALLPGLIGRSGSRQAPSAGGQPSIPARFAGFSPLTAPLSEAPSGRAIAAYVQGSSGPRVFGRQALVVGADGDVYRRVDVAERRGGNADDGEWAAAPVLLAPYGDRLAVSAVGPADDIAVVDLRSGAARHYQVAATGLVHLLAFSPDGRQLAYLVAPDASTTEGQLVLLDLDTGKSRPFAEGWQVTQAAFAPDGSRVALRVGAQLLVYDRAGQVERKLVLPTEHGYLGPLAWSPDGTEIAIRDDSAQPTLDGRVPTLIVFLDVNTNGAARPPLELAEDEWEWEPVAWRSADTLLMAGHDGLYEVPVDGGQRRRVTRFGDGGVELFRVDNVQVATALLPDAVVRPAGDPDRGPWPTWFWATIAVTTGLVAVAVLRTPARRRRLRSLLRRRNGPAVA